VSVFRRRKKDEADEVEAVEQVDVPQAEDEAEAPAALARPTGPWDHDDRPDDEVKRVDLGGLMIPVPSETEVRVDVNPEGEVVAATLVRGTSAMQVSAFAAPRTYGIWGEVREEIAAALRQGGGQAEDADGPYGTELHAAVPTQVPGKGIAPAPARFIGVDGPRWFLRALLTGPAANDPAAAAALEAALKDIVVVRGSEAMAVRDPLALRLPKDVALQAAGSQAPPETAPQETAPQEAASEQPSLELPERGPEITERR